MVKKFSKEVAYTFQILMNIQNCPTSISVAATKMPSQKPFLRERGLIQTTVPGYSPSLSQSQSRHLKQLVTSTLKSMLSSLSTHIQEPQPKESCPHSGLGPPTSINAIKTIFHKYAQRLTRSRQFLMETSQVSLDSIKSSYHRR